MPGLTELLIKSAAWSEADAYIALVLESAQTFARKIAQASVGDLNSVTQAGLAAGAVIQQTRGIGHKRMLIAGQPGFVQRSLDMEDTVANEAVGIANVLRGDLLKKFRDQPHLVNARDIRVLQEEVGNIVQKVKRLSQMRAAMLASIANETKTAEIAKRAATARKPKLAPIAKRLDKLIDKWEPELKKAFQSAVAALRSNAQVGAIVSMIEKNDVEGALRAVSLDPAALRVFDRRLVDAFESGGNTLANAFPNLRAPDGLRMTFQFNIRNPAAERWLAQHSSSLITEILEDQRTMIRNELQAAMLRGENPRTAALRLVGRIGASGSREGGLIGLTSSQAEWARNYAAELASDSPLQALSRKLRDARFDATVRRYAEAGEAIPGELRDKMVSAYTNRALRYRAEAIARTEAMAALHEAQQQTMAQAVESGVIAPEAVTYIWRATKDARTRDSHAEMDGQEQPMGEMFITGDGNELAFPGDPNGEPRRSYSMSMLA
jgi:uncharacterized protein YukE